MIARKKKAIVRRETGGERIWFDEVEGKRGKSLSSEIWNGDQFVSTAKLWRFLVPVLIFEQRSRKLCRLAWNDFSRLWARGCATIGEGNLVIHGCCCGNGWMAFPVIIPRCFLFSGWVRVLLWTTGEIH